MGVVFTLFLLPIFIITGVVAAVIAILPYILAFVSLFWLGVTTVIHVVLKHDKIYEKFEKSDVKWKKTLMKILHYLLLVDIIFNSVLFACSIIAIIYLFVTT